MSGTAEGPKKPVEIEELGDGRINIHLDEDWVAQQTREAEEFKDKFMKACDRARDTEGELDFMQLFNIITEELG